MVHQLDWVNRSIALLVGMVTLALRVRPQRVACARPRQFAQGHGGISLLQGMVESPASVRDAEHDVESVRREDRVPWATWPGCYSHPQRSRC